MGVFSKTCEYGIRAVLYIAHRTIDGSRVGIKEIAAEIDSPESFLAKILQDLSRKGLIQSMKGPNGGFYVEAENLQRPLADIVTAIDGEEVFSGCGMGLTHCSEKNPCPLHKEFKKVRNQLAHMMNTTTIGQFNKELLKGSVTLRK
ncbi:Rrf2 family transcriptional regulator [Paraflavitalea sp. CAU 1676]|uniref:RrF2 family transcriptional regulator n=1 Tax=Paraflavitalea sp. CAU 1676 TaxID=3032598 RepID=UPI0023DC05A6|nr:Rrf2 family transcriptional regulator [Paraflavitalea sp. CAU 1676]MDF2193217.1 Rrf2 family transcriptional regulator [Paraflavitalea sp. CAU 1676]